MITRPAWAEIDLAAVASNIEQLRKVTVPKARMMAVVKANAYGHGAVAVSKTVLAHGAEYLGVAILDEGRELRAEGISAPILLLGFTPYEQASRAIELDLIQTVYNFEGAEAISRAAVKTGKRGKIHVKVDTGMGRLGFPSEIRTPQEILHIAGLPAIEIEGIFTHFAVADIRDKAFTHGQYERFMEIDGRLRKLGLQIPIRHAANSAALIDLPETQLDMVRAGVSLYGLYPSDEVLKEKIVLKPALTLKARVAYIKNVPAGTSISYGRTHITDRETTVATIPVGYADGYTRLLSNKSEVIIHGRRVPVIGTICMDQFMVDVTSISGVVIGDEVTLIGRQGEEQITADELAGLVGTINYEIVCMISDRIPRIYV